MFLTVQVPYRARRTDCREPGAGPDGKRFSYNWGRYQSRNWILVSRGKNNVYKEGTIDWLASSTIVHKLTLKYKNANYSSMSIPNTITPFLPLLTSSSYPSFSPLFSHRNYPSFLHRNHPASRTFLRVPNFSVKLPVYF